MKVRGWVSVLRYWWSFFSPKN